MDQDINPIQVEIDRVRASDELKNVMHPSHERALQTLSELYARLHPEPVEEPVENPEVVEPTQQTLKVEDIDAVPQAELDGLAPLREEWGSSFDSNLQQAQSLAGRFSQEYGSEFDDWLEDSRAGSHPLVVKAFASWAKGEAGPDVSPQQARELIEVLRSGTYYGRADSKMHDVLHSVITKLFEIAYPD
jgi:hypothetical protein